MRRFEYIMPWVVFWLPAVVITGILLSAGSVKVFKPKTPAFPSMLGPVPQTFLASLETSFAASTTKIKPEVVEVNPFTVSTRKTPEFPVTPVEPASIPKERIRVGAVFIINGSKVCLINGSPHREGSNILQRGLITGIETNKVTIRIGDEEKIVPVGQDLEI